MKKNIWLVAGITGMLLGMPQTTAQAEYRGDRIENRAPRRDYDEYRRYEHRHDRDRFERRRWEREERRRLWREEERRRRRHDFDRHRYDRDRRY
jgi:hypothetical protein